MHECFRSLAVAELQPRPGCRCELRSTGLTDRSPPRSTAQPLCVRREQRPASACMHSGFSSARGMGRERWLQTTPFVPRGPPPVASPSDVWIHRPRRRPNRLTAGRPGQPIDCRRGRRTRIGRLSRPIIPRRSYARARWLD
jgi:hypothetical protein